MSPRAVSHPERGGTNLYRNLDGLLASAVLADVQAVIRANPLHSVS
jgi:hypothetical protein